MKSVKVKDLCYGCYNDEYNHGLGGSKECWSYKDAKLEKKIEIHINQSPPYDIKKAFNFMSCYNKQQYVYVKPENLSADGYWK